MTRRTLGDHLAARKACREIIAHGFNTESTSSTNMRAFLGSELHPVKATPWCKSWREVLAAVNKLEGK